MKINWKITLMALCIAGYCHGQIGSLFKTSQDRGDAFFNDFAYTEAIEEYKMALEKSSDPILYEKIAECYRKLNDPLNSVEWYTKAVEHEVSNPEVYLRYGEALSSLERYEEAKKWYQKYSSIMVDDERPKEKIKAIDNLKNFRDRSAEIVVKKASFNSEASDFSPEMYEKEQVVFVSSRASGKAKANIFRWDKSEYLNLYVTTEGGGVKLFNANINTKYHEGPLSIYDGNRKMIFTRNDFTDRSLGSDNEGTTKLKLYLSERDSTGGWSKPEEFQYNNSQYSVGHPAVSEDGLVLVFASDMPGGFGGTDLYKSEWRDNQWSKPVNLGEEINSKGNDLFPFLTDTHQLFFSSDGHGGFGGLDLFGVDLSKRAIGLVNLGKPMNSSFDDFGIAISGDHGYFSSNREGGKNNDNIYQYEAKIPLLQVYTLQLFVGDEEIRQPLQAVDVVLYDTETGTMQKGTTQNEGIAEFRTESQHRYAAVVKKDKYLADSVLIPIHPDSMLIERKVYLKQEKLYNVAGVVKDDKTGEPLSGVRVVVVNKKTGEKVAEGFTNEKGEFKVGTNESTTDAEYVVQMEEEGQVKEIISQPVTLTPGTTQLAEAISLNTNKTSDSMEVRTIYYDLNKAEIRSDAKQELDEVVRRMNTDKSLTAELYAHTDSRGNASFNQQLSTKRYQQALRYLTGKGISKERISGKGMGEKYPVNNCVDKTPCSEAEHQENRRTEIKLKTEK